MSQRGKSGKRQPNRNDEPGPSAKRRKGRPKAAPAIEDEDEGWTAREVQGGSIYNQRATEAPAELFRKDLISAMKLPDNEPLASDEFYVISDQWKPEWERGVQVPVNPDSLPEPHVTIVQTQPRKHEFKFPKSKFIRITLDDRLSLEDIHLSSVAARAEAACHYDLDDMDVAWLAALNGERARMGYSPVTEDQLERVIEELEHRCWDKIQCELKSEEGDGIEYDENVLCDVCRSPDSEEGNEMVFCDSCNICVHQACYGILTIPPGSWLCRTCALSKRPECVLCPNKEGAMKCTKPGSDWAHVSCALWIPEVSIGCVERMEPITKISNIPQSRWALICVLCKERVGACIQCSVRTCKTAYHVTCAFKKGLEMRAIIEDEQADDGVKLRSYCEKHGVKKDRSDEEERRRRRRDMTSEERNQARATKLQAIEAEFYKHVSITDVAGSAVLLEVDTAAIESVYNYWKLKRRAGNNVPLLPARSVDFDAEDGPVVLQDVDKLRLFIQLRQNLERVRNLCYMVSRREKISRSLLRTREQTFHKQYALLQHSNQLNPQEIAAVLEANHGPNIYDRLYSHENAPDNTNEFDKILVRIQGGFNGLTKTEHNPYKKNYVNGATRRKSLFGSSSESGGDRRGKIGDSSSEDERWNQKPLRRLQREVGRSLSEDSDELLPLPHPTPVNRVSGHIYSDTDSDNSLHDDKNSMLKTKGALKAFTAADRRKVQRKAANNADKENIKSSKSRDGTGSERTADKNSSFRGSKRNRDDVQNISSEDNDKAKVNKVFKTGDKSKTEDRLKEASVPDKDISLGYVPQRQAAKKATETIKSGLKPQEEAKVLSEKKREETKRRDAEEAEKKSPRSATSSSSSSSYSSSSSDSSSESEEEQKPKSIFDPEPFSRKGDLPFLDKEPKSDDVGDRKFKKAPCKKLKTSDGRPEDEFQPPTLTREEPRARSSNDRMRGSRAQSRDLSEDSSVDRESGKGKSSRPLSKECNEKTRLEPAVLESEKNLELDNRLRRKSSRNAEPVKERPPESPVKQKKDDLPIKRGPGRPRRTSTRRETTARSPPKNEINDKAIPSDDESKPKAKPMPRSVKKALGLEISPVKKETTETVEEIKPEPKEDSEKRSDSCEKSFEKDKFRRSSRLQSDEKPVIISNLESENNNGCLEKALDIGASSPDLGALQFEVQKATQSSVFSPPHNRDNLADILDFDDDIAADDDSVIGDRPLGQFNINSDLIFREDSKEDSKRETYNLVEKLRMDYAKKCGSQEALSPLSKELLDNNKFDTKSETDKRSENGLSQSETATDSQGPPPTPGYHLDNHTMPSGKYTPNSQDSQASLNKSTDSPASQNYLLHNTPLTPLSQNYLQQHTPQTPSSQNYQQQHTPQTPSSQNYQQQHTPQTPSSQNYQQQHTPQTPSSQNYQPQTPSSVSYQQPQTPSSQNYQQAPQTPYMQHTGPLTPTNYPAHNTPQPQTPSATSSGYPPQQTVSTQPFQPAAGLTPQAFSNSQSSLIGGYVASTPQQVFPPSAVMDAATTAAFNGATAFPAGATVFPTGPPYDGIYEACANSLRESAKMLMGDKVEGGSGSDERWLPPNSNASSSVFPSPSENCSRWQESQVLSTRSSSASVTSESESKEPDVKADSNTVANAMHMMPHMDQANLEVDKMPEADMFLPPYQSQSENTAYHPYSDPSSFALPYGYQQMYHSMVPKPTDESLTLPFPPTQPNILLNSSIPQIPNPESQPLQNVVNKKSTPRPTRVSARVISQGKSPDKSPKGKEVAPKRGRGASSGARGRGRGRGRGRHTPFYEEDTLSTKLAGTVYDMDFDEDGCSESLENLKAMRDRRKSTDIHDKKIPSPLTPVPHTTPTPTTCSIPIFPDVAPPLPGPVDMRTYSYEPPVNSVDDYQNHLLGAFSNPAEAPHINEIDEEMERELQSALKKSPAPPTPTSTPPVRPEPPETPDNASKTSLSDSRNQLKVKIKGPFLDSNYSATFTTLPSAPPPVQPVAPVQDATSTLRRMRKKELLRQYCAQDMNMDEAPAAPQVQPRTAITIPKAVASMTSIPTRDDYKALIDAYSDKNRKDPGSDMTDEDEPPPTPERRASTGSNNSIRTKVSKPPTPTPKLKIKLGTAPQVDIEKKVLRVRHPKKRHTNVVMPSVEELKRDCMKFRKRIMADFGEDCDRPKPKKKKKRRRRDSELPSGPPPKITIKLGKERFSVKPSTNHRTDDPLAIASTDAPPPALSMPFPIPVVPVTGVSSLRTPKSSPIRLKFARSEEGSYVMASGQDPPTDCPPVSVR